MNHSSAAPHLRSRSGSALVPGLLVVMVTSVMSVVCIRLSVSKHAESLSFLDSKRAFYVAEAGFAEALMGLASGKSGNVGSDVAPARFADGVLWVTAEDAGPGKLALKSTGLHGTGRCALSMVVEKADESVASLGVFAGQDLIVQQGCIIDSYDSRDGSYVLQTPGTDARLGSNQGITASGGAASTLIRGDATPGPESTVVRGSNVTITGSTTPREEAVVLPPIEPPALAQETSVVHSNRSVPLTIPPGDHGYVSLWVKSRANLVIVGPGTLVTDELKVDADCTLTINATDGPVKIYVNDYMALKSGSKISMTNQVPESAALLISAARVVDRTGDGVVDPPVVLNATGKVYGTIYAPNADVTLPSTLEVFGSVAARKLTLAPNGRVHFDKALVEMKGVEEGLPHMSCWRVVELPQVPLVQDRTDPLRALEIAGIVPVDSKDAHYDIGVLPPTNDPSVVPFTGGLPGVGPPPADDPPAGTEPIPPQAAALIALLDQQPAVASKDLKDDLKDASPVHASVLKRMMERMPAMKSGDLKDVLKHNSPLPGPVLAKVLDNVSKLSSGDLKDVLKDSSPLPLDILALVQLLPLSELSLSDRLSVLDAQ